MNKNAILSVCKCGKVKRFGKFEVLNITIGELVRVAVKHEYTAILVEFLECYEDEFHQKGGVK